MAEELKKNLGFETQLIEGGRGVFDVHLDGALVYSKHQTGRFPDPGEVTALLKRKPA